jgi:hypothetical protein
MKPVLIAALSFLFTNLAMADGIVVYGKDIEGYAVASDQYVMLWLSGDLARVTYDYMKEESKENITNCTGTIKQFPGFLCLKNENIFECFIKINTRKGILEGDSTDLCEQRISIAKKTSLTAHEIFSGDNGMSFRLIGDTAKMLYNQMIAKPIYNNPASCLGGPVKQFEGLECTKYKKQQYRCEMGINLETKKMALSEMCPQE